MAGGVGWDGMELGWDGTGPDHLRSSVATYWGDVPAPMWDDKKTGRSCETREMAWPENGPPNSDFVNDDSFD